MTGTETELPSYWPVEAVGKRLSTGALSPVWILQIQKPSKMWFSVFVAYSRREAEIFMKSHTGDTLAISLKNNKNIAYRFLRVYPTKIDIIPVE